MSTRSPVHGSSIGDWVYCSIYSPPHSAFYSDRGPTVENCPLIANTPPLFWGGGGLIICKLVSLDSASSRRFDVMLWALMYVTLSIVFPYFIFKMFRIIIIIIIIIIKIIIIIIIIMCGPQIRLRLFTFRPIASKQLNSLTTIFTLSWLSSAEVAHPLWVREVRRSIPGSSTGLYVWLFFCFSIVVLLLFFQKHIVCHKICNFYCNFNLFSILIFYCKMCDRL